MNIHQQDDPILHEGPSAEARLNNLGLSSEWLVDAVHASEVERQSCSVLEPSIAPGFKAWAAGFRRLAEELVPRGWAKIETRGLPRLVNKETAVAVAVCNGDDGTGLRGREPRSKHPRGVQSVLLVRSNRRQLNLPFGDERFTPVPPDREQVTWWLLVYSNGEGSLRAELALPVGLDDDRRFSVWKERIILDVPESEDFERRVSDDDEPPMEIAVNVRPKN